MAARPSWNGFLKFNLIAMPVKGYNAAASGGGKIGFHLLHKKCHSRIRYKKVCPVHGEVSNDEIVSGHEYAKGQYATVDADERSGLRAEDEKTIDVAAFVRPGAIDPLYFSGRTYYLVPEGKVAQKPYAVLLDAMQKEDRSAVAQVVFAGRTQVAIVRPCEGILAMSLLHFESEVKTPASFAEEIEGPSVLAEERKLARTLVNAATTDRFDLGQFKDEYAGRLAKLVEGKAKRGRPKAKSQSEDEPAVINLMDALRQSLHRTQKQGSRSVSKAPRTVPRVTRSSKKRKSA